MVEQITTYPMAKCAFIGADVIAVRGSSNITLNKPSVIAPNSIEKVVVSKGVAFFT